MFVKLNSRIKKVMLLSYINHHVNLLLSLQNFCLFLINFCLIISNSSYSFTIILCNFNARYKSWWSEDVTSYEATYTESLPTMHDLQQLISHPAHLFPYSSSFTGLIFTDQPNLAVDSGIHPSVHLKCHNQIIECKFNLMTVYTPPWEHLVQDYKRASTDSIINSINQVDWKFFLLNKNVHQ